ncbi:MAG: MmgE/PrpD family protein [Phycisphaerales bacterium JB040]
MAVAADTHVRLPAGSNQALGLAHYAIDFITGDAGKRGEPDQRVLDRTNLFFTDAVVCGLSALSLKTNAPTVLREEALQYPVSDATHRIGRAKHRGATVFGSSTPVQVEKAIVANCSAVREWDSNGTNFGYNPELGHTAGEFGHNDFYSVCIAGAQLAGLDGATALRAMVCHDEIRGRLAEVFSLKTYKIDHVVHGAIASAAVFGAMMGATAEQIESAIGMVVAHAIPFRAIRAGKQLSDSKGASAAISTEFAITAVRRSMMGFRGPRDIFRNPEAIFRIFEGPGQMFKAVNATEANTKPADASPFELVLGRAGSDFAVMGMHFKLGLYEHQSAGALQALITLLDRSPYLLDDATGASIEKISITAYEPAFGIIGDPAKRNPTTRQSADHSMVYIVATKLRKALGKKAVGWTELMLDPYDYCDTAIHNERTRELMEKIEFVHGGPEYDAKYPDGIPTSMTITDSDGTDHGSGLVMYPAGHARNTEAPLEDILEHKFKLLGELAFENPEAELERFHNLGDRTAEQIAALHSFELQTRDGYE